MNWIYFDEQDRMTPMRDCIFESLEGGVDLRGHYGRCNLVLFFSHGEECTACRSVAQELSRHASEFAQQDAQVLVILPELSVAMQQSLQNQMMKSNIRVLMDRGGAAKQIFVEDLYNADEQSAVLYVLDQYQAPYAALVGDELSVEDLFQDVVAWLNYIQIQCPE